MNYITNETLQRTVRAFAQTVRRREGKCPTNEVELTFGEDSMTLLFVSKENTYRQYYNIHRGGIQSYPMEKF